VTGTDDPATTSIDEAGTYRFSELIPQSYIVREQLQPGWELTTPLQNEITVVNLSSLNGTNGFRLDGSDSGDRFGFSVSNAGDVNGDGYDDLIIGARFAYSDQGESYVVFGKPGEFNSVVNLGTLNGTNGFRLDGVDRGDQSGFSVSSAGDVNGDGFDDLIIGAYGADPGGRDRAGESYVVFGKSGGFASAIDLSTLDGTTGFRLDGIDADDRAGYSVSSAGDVNGDGFDDVIIGAQLADPGGVNGAGASYVVFGKSSGFASVLDDRLPPRRHWSWSRIRGRSVECWGRER
jgi:hypothetical protein